jgi:IS6 family transposase
LTYIRVKGKWRYLYRAVDSSGATLDFLLSAKQDAAAAKRFLVKVGTAEPSHAARHQHRRSQRVPACNRAAQSRRRSGRRLSAPAPMPYLNNVLEQDHRAIKRRVNASQHFRSFWVAWRKIAGYEAIYMNPQARRAGVRRVRRSVRSIALLLVCLELKPNSYDYGTQLPSIPKLQHYQ